MGLGYSQLSLMDLIVKKGGISNSTGHVTKEQGANFLLTLLNQYMCCHLWGTLRLACQVFKVSNGHSLGFTCHKEINNLPLTKPNGFFAHEDHKDNCVLDDSGTTCYYLKHLGNIESIQA